LRQSDGTDVFQMQNNREAWVNYSRPGGFSGPGAELLSAELMDSGMRPGPKIKILSRRGIDAWTENGE
jgi:hypothetical protein